MNWEGPLLIIFLLSFGLWVSSPSEASFVSVDFLGNKHYNLGLENSDLRGSTSNLIELMLHRDEFFILLFLGFFVTIFYRQSIFRPIKIFFVLVINKIHQHKSNNICLQRIVFHYTGSLGDIYKKKIVCTKKVLFSILMIFILTTFVIPSAFGLSTSLSESLRLSPIASTSDLTSGGVTTTSHIIEASESLALADDTSKVMSHNLSES
ncbi:MAG: hypothetical protein GWN01_11000, partial [Nitrosopumilaceae archaeon]|nr:hypothetical protein [Nitrosopumilaceae archaeon]NIU87772.1 hypothetical protein [Nitrosopumilaceae archaeon]NIX62016.1 hypothetical protein [Nitrosopumilaceae archaeon]